MKTLFALTFTLALAAIPLAAQAKSSTDLKIELAKKIFEEGIGQCGDTNSDVGYLLLTAGGFSWNTLYNSTEGNDLDIIGKAMLGTKGKSLLNFWRTNLPTKIYTTNSYRQFSENKVEAVAKALPGTIFHEQDAAGAVITFIQFGANNSVEIHAPQRDSEKVSKGTYKVLLKDDHASIQLAFPEKVAEPYSGAYTLKDENILGANYGFRLDSFEVMLVGEHYEFSTEKDRTECSDY